MAAAARPDRERFLRRLESGEEVQEDATPIAKGKKTVRIDDTMPDTKPDDTLRFLQEAGFGDAQVDPSSLAALREMWLPMEEEEEEEKNESIVPLREIQANPVVLRRQASDLTQSRFSIVDGDDARTDATTAGSLDDRTHVMNKTIMDQLDTQTALLMDVQRQLEELRQTVEKMQAEPQPRRRAKHSRSTAAHQAQPQSIPRVAPQEEEPQQQQQQHPQQQERLDPLARITEIVKVFWAMQRQQVRVDGGMLFKVFFVLLILSSRVNRRRPGASASFWSQYRMYFGIAFVAIGFMVQTGYVAFLHNFFVKNNVPARIWNGETIHLDEIAAQNRHAPRRPVERGGWRDTFFAGAVPAPAQNNERNNDNNHNPFGFVKEILFLFGSFLFSILPMWNPEGLPPPRPPQQEEDAQEAEGDAPPDQRDAMQPLEDEEEEEGND